VRRFNTLSATLCAALTLGAIITSSAAAKSSPLELSYSGGVPVSVGQSVEADAGTWALETSGGNISCTQTTGFDGTYGVDETNGEKTDKISVNEAINDFAADSGCTNTIPFAGKTSLYIYNENTFLSNVKGKFSLSAKGKAEYTSDGAGDTALQAQWPETAGGTTFCSYELGKMKGTDGTFPGDLYATFSKQKVKLIVGDSNSTLCPKSATVSVNFDAGWWAKDEGGEAQIEGTL
jgi:hypothetical protein